MKLANKIVKEMYSKDSFSQWLGIQVLSVSRGSCKLKVDIRKEMTNGFSIGHGGIAYSLADSALAFAANTHGRHALSIETSMLYIHKTVIGDSIIATAKEISLTDKEGKYIVHLVNQEKE